MGYSRKLSALEHARKYLEAMKQADATISWVVRDAPRTSYLIRQGMHVAELHKIKDFAALRSKFLIRVQGNKVIAELRTQIQLEQQLDEMVIREVTDTLEVIGAVLHHKAERIFFPDATDIDLPRLYEWSSKNDYHIVPSSEGLTLTKQDVGDIAWTPN